MHVSIVVPVLNEAQGLRAFLERLGCSLERERRDSADVVIVDGGSDDDTVPLLRASGWPWIVAERGRGLQMNAGAAATRGEALLFLHADTTLPDTALDALRAALRAGAVGGFFRVRLDSDRRLLRWVGHLISARSRLTGIATGDQAIFVRRDAFEQLGGFAPLPLFEDVDLMRRLKRLGRVAALPCAVTTSARRWEGHGPWRTILRMWCLRLLYYLGLRPERLARYYGIAR